jgi:hypothetical protein
MREEQMPASVAPEGFQTHQGFVSRTTSKLSRSLEAALFLAGTAAGLRHLGALEEARDDGHWDEIWITA